MKPLLLFSSIILLILLAGFVLTKPPAANLLRYFFWSITPAARAVEGRVDSKNANIHYVTYGTGSPVLLLHGGLSHHLIWFSQVPWLVASGRRVILIDSRGHGKSDLGHSELSYHLLAADVIQVLNQLDILRTDVIGWSDGANTALLLALDWPQRIRQVVAISGNSEPSGLTSEAQAEGQIPSSGITYWFYRWWTGAGKHLDELEKQIRQLWRKGPHLQSTDLNKIEAPVLVVVGEHDLVTVDHAKKMASSLPYGHLSIIPDSGHLAIFTRAHVVNKLIRNFLGIPTSKQE